MNDREKLIALIEEADQNAKDECDKYTNCGDCPMWGGKARCRDVFIADLLLANGVVVQDDIKEMVGRGLDNIHWRIYGANKEFNDRMSAYNPSAFCAGFEYAIQLAKGLLTQLPQPPKEVE